MSDIDNATLVESAIEMEPPQVEQDNAAPETPTTEVVAAVSNQEAMIALVLSRLKRQSKQIDGLNTAVRQLPSQQRTAERAQARQFRQLGQRISGLQAQVRQLQSRIGRLRVNAARTTRRTTSRKARRSARRKR